MSDVEQEYTSDHLIHLYRNQDLKELDRIFHEVLEREEKDN